MSKNTWYILGAIVVLGFLYWHFIHKKHGASLKPHGTPAVKRKGGGGWRHRFSKIGKIASHIPGVGLAESAANKYVGAMTGGMVSLSDVGKIAGV